MTASIIASLCLVIADVPADKQKPTPMPVLVVVGMDGCQACHDLWGAIEQMAPTRNKLGWRAEYYDAFDDANEAYVRGIGAVGVFPQVLLFRNSKVIARRVGGMDRDELVAWLAAHGVVTMKPSQTVRAIIEVPVRVEVAPANGCPGGNCNAYGGRRRR